MLLKWHFESDEAFIERIRRWNQFGRRFKWPLRGLAAIVTIGCLFQLSSTFANPFAYAQAKSMGAELAFATGLLKGFLIGLLVYSMGSFFYQGLYNGDTERLILDYHDRLAQAGLLPENASETMNSAGPASPRS